MVKFQRVLKEMDLGTAIKMSFPGCTASQLRHYMEPTLNEENPDKTIICVGTNNLTKKNQTAMEIVDEIMEIVFNCRQNGVNEVYVSGIPCRPGYQNKIDDINRILEVNGKNFDYEFISNSNIEEHHLFRDKLHLNNQGVVVLATNFLTALGKPSYVDNFY